MVFYLAGPMTGIAEYNAPAFRAAAQYLRSQGYTVLSPVEMDEADGISLEAEAAEHGAWDWARALARDITVVIREADAVCVLPGWRNSRGAFLETSAAWACNKPVVTYPHLALVTP